MQHSARWPRSSPSKSSIVPECMFASAQVAQIAASACSVHNQVATCKRCELTSRVVLLSAARCDAQQSVVGNAAFNVCIGPVAGVLRFDRPVQRLPINFVATDYILRVCKSRNTQEDHGKVRRSKGAVAHALHGGHLP